MLEQFLNSKPLYYDKIDYTAMPKIWESVKHYFSLPKIIHIIGTNGKGSTGRFLAEYLYGSGFSCGHFSSPHIKRFNERFWKNANEATDTLLEEAHKKLISILPKAFRESISYFEYSALLAAVLFEDSDYAIFEAGLGGEYDATNVFKKELSFYTKVYNLNLKNFKKITIGKHRGYYRVAIELDGQYLYNLKKIADGFKITLK